MQWVVLTAVLAATLVAELQFGRLAGAAGFQTGTASRREFEFTLGQYAPPQNIRFEPVGRQKSLLGSRISEIIYVAGQPVLLSTILAGAFFANSRPVLPPWFSARCDGGGAIRGLSQPQLILATADQGFDLRRRAIPPDLSANSETRSLRHPAYLDRQSLDWHKKARSARLRCKTIHTLHRLSIILYVQR